MLREVTALGPAREHAYRRALHASTEPADWPVLICLLGCFRVIKRRQPQPMRGGGKTEALLSVLALARGHAVQRDVLLSRLWPDSDTSLARQSFNTLLYKLHVLLGDAIGAAPPVLHTRGGYRLNEEAGLAVDVTLFEGLATDGVRHAQQGDDATAVASWERAIRLYSGDLTAVWDSSAVVERERLRALYLALLARLAEHYYTDGDYETCLERTDQILTCDPCREDAHRLAIRCHLRRGQRAQALRQYRLCEQLLRCEFDAPPEPATTELFERIRLDPLSI
jgi:DNA-binding SARP family transcriptional activator